MYLKVIKIEQSVNVDFKGLFHNFFSPILSMNKNFEYESQQISKLILVEKIIYLHTYQIRQHFENVEKDL